MPAQRTNQVIRRLLGPSLILIAALVMMIWTWNTWCDPITDFGREVYVPWRLSEGDVLYRDIAYFNGPLSPYINATVFRVLGVSIQSLVLFNLLIWAVMLVMIYHLWTQMGDRFAAAVACIVFTTLFSFDRLTVLGNYTWACPYSHEITHGIALSFAGLCCIDSFARHGGKWKLTACGALLGLILLTKVEVALSAAVALPSGVIMALRFRREPIRLALIALPAIIVAPLSAFFLLRLAMPTGTAFDGVLGSWRFVADANLRHMPFYADLLGLKHPAHRITMMLILALGYVLLLAPGIALGMIRARTKGFTNAIMFFAIIIPAGPLTAAYAKLNWNNLFGGLTAVTIIAVVLTAISIRRQQDAKLVTQISVALFALVLIAKMFFNVVIYHYGFALAMPAMLLAVLMATSWIPARLPTPCAARATAVTVLAFIISWHLNRTAGYLRTRTLAVGTGSDLMYDDQRDASLPQMLSVLQKLSPTATLAALPEGAILNYLTRHVNPTGQIVVLPVEIEMFGEDKILGAFRSSPPEYIVAARRNTSEFGAAWFGQDYAHDLFAWTQMNYRPQGTIDGSIPMTLLFRAKSAESP